MDIFYYLLSPFAWLLKFFYNISGSYGIALILFAVVVKLILFPFSIKSKRSMIQMNQLSGRMQQLQKQYANNRERYNLEVQKLYEKEKVNPMGGCLWSFLPIFFLWPLYSIIRQPLYHMMGLTVEQIETVAQTLNWSTVALEKGWINQAADSFANIGYQQMYLASLINQDTLETVKAALGEAGSGVFAINFRFLGLDLAMLPTWKLWEHPTWPYIGAFLMVLVSALSGVLISQITMRTNRMNNQQQSEQVEQTNRTMMLMMPLMSLWIGFIMPTGLCLYWVAQNFLTMIQEIIAGKMLKKDYEAARLAAEQRAIEEKEAEKQRREEARLERERRLEEEKKKKSEKKKKAPAPGPAVNKEDSKVGMRAYARGRAYDPNRFGGVTPYRDPNTGKVEQPEAENDLFLPEDTASQEEKKKEEQD